MLEFIYCVLAGAVARRFKGGGFWGNFVDDPSSPTGKREEDKIPKLRRYGSPFLFGGLILLGLHDWKLAAISIVGFSMIDVVGTGDMFAVLHGGFDGIIKKSILNSWIYGLCAKIVGDPIPNPMTPAIDNDVSVHNCAWGFFFATFRGCYKLVLSTGVAVYTGHWWIFLLGLLGMLDGIIYFVAGRIAYHIKGVESVTVAEIGSGSVVGGIVGSSSLLGGGV